jgi:hypothetical protein
MRDLNHIRKYSLTNLAGERRRAEPPQDSEVPLDVPNLAMPNEAMFDIP